MPAVLVVSVTAVYLGAAVAGGVIPNALPWVVEAKSERAPSTTEREIFVVSNWLHADILLPADTTTMEVFDFLRGSSFPVEHPDLRYLVVGWGSREFYTSTRDYADMEFRTVWRAATGDRAVMHVAPAGPVAGNDDLLVYQLSDASYQKLLGFILESFAHGPASPQLIEGASFGFGDVFYEGQGWFNIFNPCNVWISRALKASGVPGGIWTPTTLSLKINHFLYHHPDAG